MKKLLVALIFSASAHANTYMFDHADLWWNANESGWGVTVTHQKEVIFLTFFIYGTDGKASWYTGQASYLNNSPQGQNVFTGVMYQVAGPWFGTTFNPALVNARQVGTMTFSAFTNSATLTYSIDGITVTKNITRQTFRRNEINTIYHGTTRTVQSGCIPTSLNGTYLTNTSIGVLNTDTTLRMTSIGAGNPPDTCTYNGSYQQTGRLGISIGTYSCNTGASGSYTASAIDASTVGVTARLTGTSNFCSSVITTYGGVAGGIWIQ